MGGALRRPLRRWFKTDEFYSGVFILPSSHLFSKSLMLRTRGARGGSELNRTFHESPAARLRYRSGGNLAEIFPYNFSFARAP